MKKHTLWTKFKNYKTFSLYVKDPDYIHKELLQINIKKLNTPEGKNRYELAIHKMKTFGLSLIIKNMQTNNKAKFFGLKDSFSLTVIGWCRTILMHMIKCPLYSKYNK